jgi:bifunctional NMN adenylyltransferase/nudix hydrolase
MAKTFKLGLIVGRFQHFHNGHKRMVDTALATCEKVLLLIGSSQESMTERNPFNLKTRMDIVRDVYDEEIKYGKLFLGHIDDMTNENDVRVEWGDFVLQKVDMWTQHYGLSTKVDCMIFGNDENRMGWYRPEAVEHISQIAIARTLPISATRMRHFLLKGDISQWYEHMPLDQMGVEYWFNRLKGELLYVPHYKEMLIDEN